MNTSTVFGAFTFMTGLETRHMNAARRRVAQRIIEKGETPKPGNEAVKQYAELYGLKITKRISQYLIDEYNNPKSLIYKTTLGKEKNAIKAREKNLAAEKRRNEYLEYLNSDKWRAFRLGIMKERGRKCEKCGQDKGEIHAHHLTYERFMNELPEDIQLLCKPCHMAVHNRRNKKKEKRKLTKALQPKKPKKQKKSKRPQWDKIPANPL